ncbi:APC family permease [Pseudochelatococcus contaminans]|uniref:Amino acid transporter n=1 Tax=Pseudochelatococcus contaminans TaxID=1538103 RepID=A0A7W5Z5J2_9HYPH|nr:APC family permease [Pseudochelatococcus contaminans]MBB3810240.1 amino acid transporter [Pseudochelatococcus contaminans]
MKRDEVTRQSYGSAGVADIAGGSKSLQGNLGVGAIVFMVLAAAAPLTVIGGNVPLAIGLGNGAGAPVGFVVAVAVLLLFSVGFVAMTPYVRDAGAFFSYVTEGLGARLGTGIAAVALVAYTAIQVGIYGYLGWAMNDTMRIYNGPNIPWPVWSFLAWALVAWLGYRNIHLSAKVLGLALVLEVLIVVVMDLVIFGSGGNDGINVQSFSPAVFTSGSLGIAVLFSMTGFIGFESTAIFRDEARDPAVTIPRATYVSVLLIGSFYALSTWALVLGSGVDNVRGAAEATLAGEANLLLDQSQLWLGKIGQDCVNVLLLTSLLACVLSFHNVIARYQHALARKGLLWARLGAVHDTHASPHASSLVQSATAAVIIAIFALLQLDPLVEVFGSMAGVATLGMIILMLTTSLSVLGFFRERPDLVKGRVWQTRIAPTLASIGLAGCLWLVISNFTLITGGSLGISIALAAIPVAALALGWLRGPQRG